MSPDTDHEPGYFGKEDPRSDGGDDRDAGAARAAATTGDPVVTDAPVVGDVTGASAGAAMAATGTLTAPDEIEDDRHMGHLDPGHTHGPTDGQYFTIFWVLLGLTALEVSTYFWESWFGEGDLVRRVGVTVLLTIMLIKFGLIAGFFMHLRFDAALLRRVFTFGLGAALVIYLIAMTSMNMWTDNGHQHFDDPPPEATTTTLAPEGG